MRTQLHHWKFTLLVLFFFCLTLALGVWQSSRALQKRALLDMFAERTNQSPLTPATFNTGKELRFYRLTVTGHFDNQHTVLLDNKSFHGKLGYEVYTPFQADGIANPILIDRGFTPTMGNRQTLPIINDIPGSITLTGMIDNPPGYLSLGQMQDSPIVTWPLRIEYVNLSELAQIVHYSFSQYILRLEPKDSAAYEIEWQIVQMGPERHIGYAIQWFALAFTLLILFVAHRRTER